MNEENKNVNNEQEELYFYYGEGVRFCTTNYTFAKARARFYGTEDVYVEKIK